jgi:RimJ/RimL family protein N-acetyltransferase
MDMVRTESPPSHIRTDGLLLRRQHPADAAMIKDAVDSSLAHLQASVAWAQSAPVPLASLVARLAASAAAFDAHGPWAFTIFDLDQSRVLGGAALERADNALAALVGPDAVEAGYWLRADATGRGYATEATASLTELAFIHLHAQRVVICHDPANVPSAGVPRRLGFRCLGLVSDALLPGRQAADGSIRATTTIWVRELPPSSSLDPERDVRGSPAV